MDWSVEDESALRRQTFYESSYKKWSAQDMVCYRIYRYVQVYICMSLLVAYLVAFQGVDDVLSRWSGFQFVRPDIVITLLSTSIPPSVSKLSVRFTNLSLSIR